MSARVLIIVNPRSGNGGPSLGELTARARAVGGDVRVLREGDSLEEIARTADADALAMAGGDGSLGVVAGVAVERDLPFLAVPWGTRNHFVGDLGLDTSDPLRVLDGLTNGHERRVDVGRVGGRVFLNNVSLGLYARVVHRRERGRRRREVLARIRALLRSLPDHRRLERFVVDGQPLRASVLLVANNRYRLDLLSLGERDRLDEGVLAIYAARGLRRLQWAERLAEHVRVESPRRRRIRAAVDGEPTLLESPIELRIEPAALRVLVPGSNGAAPPGSHRDAGIAG